MITIANVRACERLIDGSDTAAHGDRQRLQLDSVLADIRKRHPLPATEEERVRLADHSDLYGPDGLPR
ncbi:MAG: hypothetical protein NTV97_12985 [Alphaproteobacteria bacterium]|nr:hypothetical protein [Alphaproteobacteria bacterium]